MQRNISGHYGYGLYELHRKASLNFGFFFVDDY
jgi:hypothetical protein